MFVTFPASIRHIYVQRPQRLRRAYDEHNPDWNPEKLVVWDASAPAKTVPACVASDSPRLWLNIDYGRTFGDQPNSANEKVVLSYKEQNSHLGWSNVTMYVSGSSKDLDIDFPFRLPSTKAPYGLKRNIEWRIETGDRTTTMATTPLELYCITNDLPSVYRNEAINLELLQAVVLPLQSKSITTRDGFINHVIEACFFSRSSELGGGTKPEVHSYRYNLSSGSPRFSDLSKFDMDAWAFNKDRTKNTLVINCYDQAALLYLALSLGIPASYRTWDGKTIKETRELSWAHEENVQSVGILYKAPFGFINYTHLVGWGITDSPFFDEDNEMSRSMGLEVQKDSQGRDLFRSGFKNHKWVYVREEPWMGSPQTPQGLDQVENLRCADACAGPGLLQKLQKYLNDTIDAEANQFYPNEAYTKSLKDPSKAGTVSKGFEKYNARIKAKQGRDPPYEKSSYDAVQAEFEFGSTIMTCDLKPTIDRLRRKAFVEQNWYDHGLQSVWRRFQAANATPAAKPVQVDVSRLLAALKDRAEELYGVAPGGLEAYIAPITVGAGATLARMEVWGPKGFAPLVSVRVDVEQDLQAAVATLLDSFDAADRDRGLWPVAEDDPTRCGSIHLARRIADAPAAGLALFAYGNVAVQISGRLPQAHADALVATAKARLDAGAAASPRELRKIPLTAADVTYARAPRPRYAVPFDLTVAAPGAGKVEIAFKHRHIVFVQDPVPQADGTWTIKCVVQSPTAQTDYLHVAVAEKTTYAESDLQNIEMHIN